MGGFLLEQKNEQDTIIYLQIAKTGTYQPMERINRQYREQPFRLGHNGSHFG